MKARIALFTANVQGGILQLTVQLYKTLVEEGYDVKVVMPYEIHDTDISLIAKTDLLQYHKEKKVIDQSPYKKIAGRINNIQPEFIRINRITISAGVSGLLLSFCSAAVSCIMPQKSSFLKTFCHKLPDFT